MSPGNIADQRMIRMANNDEHWTIFLKGHGLAIKPEAIRKIAERVVSGEPLYPLYNRGKRTYVAGKGTVYKIRNLITEGKLDDLLCHWGLREPPKEDAAQLEHLTALKIFLGGETFGGPFRVKAPMEEMLNQVKENEHSGHWRTQVSLNWEALPIVSRLKSHCPDHELWAHVEQWKSSKEQYLSSIVGIAVNLQADLAFPWPEISTPSLESLLITYIFGWLTGQLLGWVPQGGSMPTIEPKKEPVGEALFNLTWAGSIYAEGAEEHIQTARAAVENVLKRWSDSEDIRAVVNQYHELQFLLKKINDEIQEINESLLGRGTCPDCPTPRST